jgi:hypothetical protein
MLSFLCMSANFTFRRTDLVGNLIHDDDDK